MWGPLPTLLNSLPFRYFFALTVGLNQRLPIFGMGELAVERFDPSLFLRTDRLLSISETFRCERDLYFGRPPLRQKLGLFGLFDKWGKELCA